uniref:Uncharacterized protein n=1 Tax=Rhizophora mucronata TaxID=61149 RepID=A0A2P2MYB7_RHIMU
MTSDEQKLQSLHFIVILAKKLKHLKAVALKGMHISYSEHHFSETKDTHLHTAYAHRNKYLSN